jgi:hypothetical protein
LNVSGSYKAPPILFWLVNERKAFRFGLLIIITAWLNGIAKAFFRQPRPFHLESALGMIGESGFGFPSGHAQFILIFIIPLTAWFCRGLKKRGERIAAWTAGILIILLVSFSRLYLGVHFPQDIAGGWALGGLSLAVYFTIERAFSAGKTTLRAFTGRRRCLLFTAGLSAVLMNALSPGSTSGAMLFGFSAGYIVMTAWFPFHAGNLRRRDRFIHSAFRLAVGFTVTALFYVGLKKLFPPIASPQYRLFRFIRYALLGFWVSAGAPWVFLRLKSRGGT